MLFARDNVRIKFTRLVGVLTRITHNHLNLLHSQEKHMRIGFSVCRLIFLFVILGAREWHTTMCVHFTSWPQLKIKMSARQDNSHTEWHMSRCNSHFTSVYCSNWLFELKVASFYRCAHDCVCIILFILVIYLFARAVNAKHLKLLQFFTLKK